MARNDASLITGLSSAASRRLEEQQLKRQREKSATRQQLKPGAEIILGWIKKEKSNITNLERIVLNVEDEKYLQAQIMALNLHLKFLDGLSMRARQILSSGPVVQEPTNE